MSVTRADVMCALYKGDGYMQVEKKRRRTEDERIEKKKITVCVVFFVRKL